MMSKVLEVIKRYCKSGNVSSEKVRKAALLVLLLPLAVIAYAVNSSAGSGSAPDQDIPAIEDAEERGAVEESASETIYVDIGGAVKEPMLAELPQGSRVEDAIVAAGGLTDKADISSINRAEFLEDGEKVYIPEVLSEEDADVGGYSGGFGSVSSDGATVPSAGGKININTADSAQLQELNGVGPATAQKIIDYRTANGRFRNIEEIKNVSGIGDKTFEKLKDDITV